MKANQLGKRRYLLDGASKRCEVHHLVVANHGGAKAALQVADIADFNMNLVKALFHN